MASLTSATHAASWLTVASFVGLGLHQGCHDISCEICISSPGLHLDPNELQIVVKWWLGLGTSRGSSCALCPDGACNGPVPSQPSCSYLHDGVVVML